MSEAADEVKDVYFPVLDHGFVALVDYMGGDAAVTRAARTSYGAGTKKTSDDRGLLRYLLRHKHTTPFEMAEGVFHMKLPIFIARQLIRHRTASVNEYSMRYSLPAMQFYMPEPAQMGAQSKKNKQGRAEQIDIGSAVSFRIRWQELQKEAVQLYEMMVDPDIDLAREIARIGLPLSLYTEWYWKIDLHNGLNFLRLRVDSHAQWEIQQFARVVAGLFQRIAPLSFESWIDYVFQSRTFSRMEMLILRKFFNTVSALEFQGHRREAEVRTTSGIITAEEAKETYGLNKREWEEFMATFDALNHPDMYTPESFTLDPTKGFTGEHFAKLAEQYLPKVV